MFIYVTKIILVKKKRNGPVKPHEQLSDLEVGNSLMR